MRSLEKMYESGDWPPTNREAIRMIIMFIIGIAVGFAIRKVFYQVIP